MKKTWNDRKSWRKKLWKIFGGSDKYEKFRGVLELFNKEEGDGIIKQDYYPLKSRKDINSCPCNCRLGRLCF